MPGFKVRLQKLRPALFAGVVLLLFLFWHVRLLPFFAPWQRLEYAQLDGMFRLRGAVRPSPPICIVAIDDASLQQIGAWPWPRRTLANLLAAVCRAQPALVIGDFILPDRSEDHAGTVELAQVMRSCREHANSGVILPYYFGDFHATRDSSLPLQGAIAASAFVLFDNPEAMPGWRVAHGHAVYHSAPELLTAALPGGHINIFSDEEAGDTAVRWENHLIRHAGSYFPSLPVQIVIQAQHLTRAQVQVKTGAGIQLGSRFVALDAQGRSWINYYGPAGSFQMIPASRILRGQDADKLRGQIVFVGVTAAGTQDFIPTPMSARMPGVEKLATVTANVLEQNALRRPLVLVGLELLVAVLLSGVVFWCSARLRPLHLGLTLAILCLMLALSSFALFALAGIWLQSAGMVLALLGTTAGLAVLRAPAMAATPLASEIGEGMPDRLGRFEITGLLGEGAMGKIFAGFDPTINRKVAIKTIRPMAGLRPSSQAKMRQRFLHEARAAGALSHPNIVTIFNADEAGPYSYLVMEFLEGQTLEENIRAGAPLALGRALEILLPICEALQYAHQQGVVHRDLKPANIMLTHEGAVKLMDFGIAHIYSSTLTQEGALLGTPSYMSPEQMLGQKVDRRSDLFALGVVAYEMTTGVQPFLADTMAAVSHRIVAGEWRRPSELNPNLPAAFDEIMQKALHKDKDKRYQTAMDFAVALVQLVPVG